MGESGVELPEQPPQEADHAQGGGRVPWPEDRRHEVLGPLGVEGERAHEGQVAPRIVVAVEEAQLLLPVRGIVRGVEIDRDAADPRRPQPRLVMGDDDIGQRLREPVHIPRRDRVLEAGERGLRGQCGPRDGVAPHEKLVDRVGLELGRIVRIRVAAGEAKAALPDEGGQIVFDLPRLAPFGDAGRQSGGQREFVVDRFEQDGAAVGASGGACRRLRPGASRRAWGTAPSVQPVRPPVSLLCESNCASSQRLTMIFVIEFHAFMNFPG